MKNHAISGNHSSPILSAPLDTDLGDDAPSALPGVIPLAPAPIVVAPQSANLSDEQAIAAQDGRSPEENAGLSWSDIQDLADSEGADAEAATEVNEARERLLLAVLEFSGDASSRQQVEPIQEVLLDNPNINLGGIRSALVNQRQNLTGDSVAEIRQLTLALIDSIDEGFPLPSKGGSGAFGNLDVGSKNGKFSLSGRPSFSQGLQAAVPNTKGNDRRHVTAWHTLRRGFEALLNNPQTQPHLLAQLEKAQDALVDQAKSLDEVKVKDLLAGDEYASFRARPENTALLTYIEGVSRGLEKNPERTVGQALESAPASPSERVKLGLFLAFNNPQNLWSGKGKDNQNLPSLYKSAQTLLRQYSDLGESFDDKRLIELVKDVRAKRKAAKTDIARGLWDTVEQTLIPPGASKDWFDAIEGKEFSEVPSTDGSETWFSAATESVRQILRDNVDTDLNLPPQTAAWSRGELASTLDSLLSDQGVKGSDGKNIVLNAEQKTVVEGALDKLYASGSDRSGAIDAALTTLKEGLGETYRQLINEGILPKSSQAREVSRAQYLGWAPSREGANHLLDAAADPRGFSPMDPEEVASSVVQGFVSSDPLRNTPHPKLEGSERDVADAQKLHKDLLANSHAYRDAFLKATWNAPGSPSGGRLPLAIKFASAEDQGEDRRAASYDSGTHTITLRASDGQRSPEALRKLGVNLAFEMLNASRGSGYRQIGDRVEGARRTFERNNPGQSFGPASGTVVDRAVIDALDLEQASLDDFRRIRGDIESSGLYDSFSLDAPSEGGEPAAKKPRKTSNEEFIRGQVVDWVASGGGDLNLRVWKPREGTLDAPSARAPEDGRTENPSDEGTRGSADTSSTTSGGGGRLGPSDGPAGFLFGPGPLEEDNQEQVEVGGGVGIEANAGPAHVSGQASGSASAEAGYTSNADRSSASAQAVAEGSASVTAGAGPFSTTVGVDGNVFAESSAGVDHHIDGDDATLGASARAGAGTSVGVSQSTTVGGVTSDTELRVGAGASAEGTGKFILRDGIPGVTVSAGFDVGASVGGSQTIGTEAAQATLEGGAIVGFALGAGGSFGMQEDGKFHIELNAKIAAFVGVELGIDLAIDIDKVREVVGNLDPREWGPKMASYVGGVLKDSGLLAKEAIDAFDEKVLGPLKNGFEAMGDAFKEGFREVAEFFREDFKDFFKEDVKDFFQEDVKDFFEDDVADFFKGAFDKVLGGLGRLFGGKRRDEKRRQLEDTFEALKASGYPPAAVSNWGDNEVRWLNRLLDEGLSGKSTAALINHYMKPNEDGTTSIDTQGIDFLNQSRPGGKLPRHLNRRARRREAFNRWLDAGISPQTLAQVADAKGVDAILDRNISHGHQVKLLKIVERASFDSDKKKNYQDFIEHAAKTPRHLVERAIDVATRNNNTLRGLVVHMWQFRDKGDGYRP